MFFCAGYAFLLLKVSWLSILITRSKARALAAQGPAESREGVLDSPQEVEWPSLPALPTPPQLPRNSRFRGVLLSFRRIVNPLRRESGHSSAPRRDHPNSDLLPSTESSQLRVCHPHRYGNWKRTTVLASTRSRVSPVPHE